MTTCEDDSRLLQAFHEETLSTGVRKVIVHWLLPSYIELSHRLGRPRLSAATKGIWLGWTLISILSDFPAAIVEIAEESGNSMFAIQSKAS